MENNEEIKEEEFEDKLYYKVERKIVGSGAIIAVLFIVF